MLPHRALSDEIFGNGLRDRVTACRKRLRINWVMHRTQIRNQVEEVFPESAVGCELPDYPANHPAVREPLVRMDYSLAFAEAGTADSETSRSIGDQEVGIT